MTVRDLLKRTPFRLAATFSLFFLTTVGLPDSGTGAEEYLVALVVEVGALGNAVELGESVIGVAELVPARNLDVLHVGDTLGGAA